MLPPTTELFRDQPRLTETPATVLAADAGGIVLDRTVFYPLGGGQAGDRGWLLLADGSRVAIADTRRLRDADGRPTGTIVHLPAPDALAVLQPGVAVRACIDWAARHRMMRLHTSTHLLCHLVPHPVNGCSITPEGARLDFHTAEPLDRDALNAGLAGLVAAAHPVTAGQITDAELDANPQLVRSMSVQPPRGSGTVRLIRIGAAGTPPVDLQPCGGTHVASTAEIGAVRVVKLEKKSALTRRVLLALDD